LGYPAAPAAIAGARAMCARYGSCAQLREPPVAAFGCEKRFFSCFSATTPSKNFFEDAELVNTMLRKNCTFQNSCAIAGCARIKLRKCVFSPFSQIFRGAGLGGVTLPWGYPATPAGGLPCYWVTRPLRLLGYPAIGLPGRPSWWVTLLESYPAASAGGLPCYWVTWPLRLLGYPAIGLPGRPSWWVTLLESYPAASVGGLPYY
jgi:hypothetical protein